MSLELFYRKIYVKFLFSLLDVFWFHFFLWVCTSFSKTILEINELHNNNQYHFNRVRWKKKELCLHQFIHLMLIYWKHSSFITNLGFYIKQWLKFSSRLYNFSKVSEPFQDNSVFAWRHSQYSLHIASMLQDLHRHGDELSPEKTSRFVFRWVSWNGKSSETIGRALICHHMLTFDEGFPIPEGEIKLMLALSWSIPTEIFEVSVTWTFHIVFIQIYKIDRKSISGRKMGKIISLPIENWAVKFYN